jgi:S1-C subfamily serine protease
MYGGKVTLYDILEISRDAKRDEIVRAYRRLAHDLKQDGTMPDAKREALLHEAYEVLSDPHRRAFYDASLRKPKFFGGAAEKARNPRWIGGLGAGLVVLVAALYFSLRGPSGPQPLATQEILAAASRSVGQLQAIDMSGRASPVGVAFAIDRGVMVSTCPVIPPGAQLVVRLGARAAPAQVAVFDGELGICKLSVQDTGSWPLVLHRTEQRAGDKVYVANVNAAGEVVLREGKVKGSVKGTKGNVIEISLPVAPAASGAPLLDTQGRVVGITSSTDAYGRDKHIALPAKWVGDARAR